MVVGDALGLGRESAGTKLHEMGFSTKKERADTRRELGRHYFLKIKIYWDGIGE